MVEQVGPAILDVDTSLEQRLYIISTRVGRPRRALLQWLKLKNKDSGLQILQRWCFLQTLSNWRMVKGEEEPLIKPSGRLGKIIGLQSQLHTLWPHSLLQS